MNKKWNSKYGLVVIGILITVLVIGYWIWKSIGIENGAEQYPLTWFIIAAAVVGSIVNQQVYSEFKQISAGQITVYIIWKCVISIALATMLYLVFAAELISGEMFPRFINSRTDNGGLYVSMIEFMTKMKPESYKDVAKILVWSFVAGYSEKFVPNLILQIVKGVGNENKTD